MQFVRGLDPWLMGHMLQSPRGIIWLSSFPLCLCTYGPCSVTTYWTIDFLTPTINLQLMAHEGHNLTLYILKSTSFSIAFFTLLGINNTWPSLVIKEQDTTKQDHLQACHCVHKPNSGGAFSTVWVMLLRAVLWMHMWVVKIPVVFLKYHKWNTVKYLMYLMSYLVCYSGI